MEVQGEGARSGELKFLSEHKSSSRSHSRDVSPTPPPRPSTGSKSPRPAAGSASASSLQPDTHHSTGSKHSSSSSSTPSPRGTHERPGDAEAAAGDSRPRKIDLHAFQKLKLLGKGAVGTVYLVQLLGSNRLFAMKVLDKNLILQKNKIRRVLTERNILSAVNHPFIVSLHCCFQTNSSVYFLIDYCAGGEFFTALNRKPLRVLSEKDTKFYAAEIILALEYLHMMGFVYRDLKPENILIDEQGHIRLTDFDLATAEAGTPQLPRFRSPPKGGVASSSSSRFHHNAKNQMVFQPKVRANSFVGTEHYVAPEVIKGTGHTSAVDWWTLGILLYRMLFGKTPFVGANRENIFYRIKKGEFNFLNVQEVSSDAKDIIKKLLVVNPTKRLGAANGAADLKSHSFFHGINWALIRNQKPPIDPVVFHSISSEDEASLSYPEGESIVENSELLEDDPFRDFLPVNRLKEKL